MNHNIDTPLYFRNILTVALLLFVQGVLLGQTEPAADGEVRDAEVVIEKERKIELNKENKRYEFIQWEPPRDHYEVPPFEFRKFKYDVTKDSLTQAPAQIKLDKEQHGYRHYAKFGFGNYASPLLDLSLTSGGNPNKMAGLNLKHESFASGEVDENHSAAAMSEVHLYGMLNNNKMKTEGALHYRLDDNYYYGYPSGTVISRADIKHQANFLDFTAQVTDKNMADLWHYSTKINFGHYSDNFTARENTVRADLSLSFSEKLFVDTEIVLSGYQDTGIDQSRSYFLINPYYRWLLDALSVDAGISISFQNDEYADLASSKFFPFARANYVINEKYSLFARLDGGFTFQSLQGFASEVPVLNQSVGLANSERLVDFSIGMTGAPADRLGVRASLGFQSVRYLPVLVNNSTDQSRIDITYDLEISNIFTFNGEAQYAINKKHGLTLGFNLYQYNSNGYSQIIHRPTSEILLSGNHLVLEQLHVKWNFVLINGLVGLDTGTDQNVELGTIPRLDVAFQYQIKERWGVFLSGENLINKRYSRYLFYPQRGIQFRLGATFKF